MKTKKAYIYLANYAKGFADARENHTMYDIYKSIEYLSDHVCGQGFINCKGGDECDSDHK